VFIEEGIREGGFGEYAASAAMRCGCRARIAVLAAEEGILQKSGALGTREELLRRNGLDGAGISQSVCKVGVTSLEA
jgi:1-deoxy-D-xylulose-5-phosphate synthase